MIVFTRRTRMDTDGCPQADDGGEQVLITDERLMIIDCENNDDR